MLRFSRKPSATDKQAKGKTSKSGKGKSHNQSASPDEYEDKSNNLIGIQECRKLLASVSRKKSAKCVATFQRKSQLSKTLVEVLMDDSVLPYFMEYMQKQNATNLLNFWLTAETFKLSTINRLRMNCIPWSKSSKGETASAIPDGDVTALSNSLLLCSVGNSLNQPNTCGNPSEVADQSCILDGDNNEFGDFTGYEPESFTSSNPMEKKSSEALLLCNHGGHIIHPTLSNKDVCDHCGHKGSSSNNTSRSSNLNHSSNQEAYFSYCSCLLDGLNQLDLSNQAGAQTIQGTPNYINNDTSQRQKGIRSSKVTFDLTPDFENEQRGFCRKRTRSIVVDAVSIYSKYISLEASNPIGLEESIRRQVEINICSEDGRICPDSFQPAQMFAYDIMERMYFPAFLLSSFYCKHQIDILTSGKVFLSDILYNQNAMFYFMEFLEQEGIQHMLEFFLAADNFQCHLKSQVETGQYTAQYALDDAMIIYDKYFSMQASIPLGVDDITRIEIENSICREGGPLPECFTFPMEHVLFLLEEVFFPSFLKSQVYYKYLTELLNSISDNPSPQALSASIGSDYDIRRLGAQSEESSHLIKSAFGSDVDLTEHPDALWQRPNPGLSLGKVNEFGIFEPIFEPDPDSGNGTSTASKLGKAMRKLVSGREDKTKEEMAWKIAKMIIEDVKNEQAMSFDPR